MDAQRLGHQEIIVKESLLTHVGIFCKRVVVTDPREHRFHARIILVQLGVGVAEHTGIADASVAAKGRLAVFTFLFAGHAFAGKIYETTLVLGVVAGPGLFVEGGQILTILDKFDCGPPVQIILGLRRVRNEVSAVIDGLNRGESVI